MDSSDSEFQEFAGVHNEVSVDEEDKQAAEFATFVLDIAEAVSVINNDREPNKEYRFTQRRNGAEVRFNPKHIIMTAREADHTIVFTTAGPVEILELIGEWPKVKPVIFLPDHIAAKQRKIDDLIGPPKGLA